MDYKIIETSAYPNGAKDLEDAVRKAIKDGWTPLGGVALLPDQSNPSRPRIWYQAMTRV